MKIFKILVLLVLIFGIFCTGCTDVQKKFSRDINKTNNAIFTPSIKAFNSALSLDAEGVKSNAVKLSQGMQKKQNTTHQRVPFMLPFGLRKVAPGASV